MPPTDANRGPATPTESTRAEPATIDETSGTRRLPTQAEPPVAADDGRAGGRPAGRTPDQRTPKRSLPAPIHRLVATVRAPACALGDADGQIRPTGVAGIYVGDTRALRGAVVTVD